MCPRVLLNYIHNVESREMIFLVLYPRVLSYLSILAVSHPKAKISFEPLVVCASSVLVPAPSTLLCHLATSRVRGNAPEKDKIVARFQFLATGRREELKLKYK